jgi:hypothetical protein
MAQWYTQLIFKGDQFLGDSLTGWQGVEDTSPPDINGFDYFTAVIISGYALYGQLQGYYALGIAHIVVDPASNKAYYQSEQSILHQESLDSLTPVQKETIRAWLVDHYPVAWENSLDAFKSSLVTEPR